MEYVADTCVLIWYLADDKTLPAEAPDVFKLMNDADKGFHTIHISTITLVELVYLIEKNKQPRELLDKLLDQLTEPGSTFVLSDLTGDVALMLERVRHSSGDKLDMPDRIIAADAHCRGVPLFTSDGKLRNSNIVAFWR